MFVMYAFRVSGQSEIVTKNFLDIHLKSLFLGLGEKKWLMIMI